MRQASRSEASPQSLSAEIWIHQLVFAAIMVPLVAMALPVVLISFATYEVFQSIGALWNGTKDPDVQVAYGPLSFFVAILLLARLVSGCRESVVTDRKLNAELASRMRLPKGAAGQVLRDTVDRIWGGVPDQGRLAPEVVWYSGFQVAAHTRSEGVFDQICVSSALWDRVTKKDLTADLILAHEIGHIVHRDWRTFQHLAVGLHGIRSTLRFSKLFAMCATATIVCLMGVAGVIQGESFSTSARVLLATIAVAVLCFLLLVLSDLSLRRYASFIVSMMEVRADLSAAWWTIGLNGFAQCLESDATLHRSTAADLRRSFFSPDVTHISESERLALIRTPDRLFTPKLRYFAWSLVLALLLPLNPITPLLFNGAIDHVVIVSTTSALYATTMTMLTLSGDDQAISWRRTAVLAAAVCCALGSTSINLYEVGYLFTHYAVAIANDTGFGRDPLLWASIGSDLALVAHGLAKKAAHGMSGWWILVAVPMTMVAMKLVRHAVRSTRPHSKRLLLALVAGAVTFSFAVVVGRDSNRSEFYDYISAFLPLGLQGLWLSTGPVRLALPAVAGLASILVLGHAQKSA